MPQPDFSLTLSSSSLSITAGSSQSLTVNATALNGFTGAITVSPSGLPAGVTANPSTLSVTSGTPQSTTLTAAANAATGNAAVTFTGTAASLSHTASLALSVKASQSAPGIDATTYHYDNARDGLNANETTLTPSNVNSATFGKINFFAADGKIDAEPLYLSQLTINGGMHMY